MQQTFYSNGKLLLTGEYVVLDGATALALPTKQGQSLTVTHSHKSGLHWNSLDRDHKSWFHAHFKLPHLEIVETDQPETAITLQEILKEAQRQQPNFLTTSNGYEVTTVLTFPRNWGLGTSSTLINNIAQWAQTNPYALLQNSFGGSGYDIAAARHNAPIFYETAGENPLVRELTLPWDFTEQLFFIYLNRKQDSKEGIARYKRKTVTEKQLAQITDLTKKLLLCYTLPDFEKIMEAHERVISEMIGLPTVKEQLFQDYEGIVKSLGAWGGDFVLATGSLQHMDYFKKKGYTTIISYAKMLL